MALLAIFSVLGSFLVLFISTPAFADEYNLDLFMKQNNIDSIQKALNWENQNIVYEKYGGFRWQLSKAILFSHKACCQGYASINYEILKRLGFDPVIYIFQVGASFQGPKHAVVIFKNGEYFNAISNSCLITSDEVSLQAFIFYLGLNHDLHFPTVPTINQFGTAGK